MEKLYCPLPVIVEGRYDKAKLSSVIDAHIVTTEGFGIFNKKEKLALIRALSEKGGIVILCDSDGAGGVIRSYIQSALPKEKVYNLYIPQIEGKEKRKRVSSKEGFLGVEGMDISVLRNMFKKLLETVGVNKVSGNVAAGEIITKTDMYFAGLTGRENSKAARDKVSEYFNLPSNMTPGALLGALNIITNKEELFAVIENMKQYG